MLKARAFGPLTPVHDAAALTVAGPRDAAGSQSQISRGRDLRIIPESPPIDVKPQLRGRRCRDRRFRAGRVGICPHDRRQSP